MISLDIPGFDHIELLHLVSDFSGTLSVDGELEPGVRERLNALSELLDVHIVTADTHGNARRALKQINATVHIMPGQVHDEVKADYIKKLGPESVVAFGNGNNDVRMLSLACLSVAVCLPEGCSVNAMEAADITVHSIADGLDLLLKPRRLVATLRR